MTNYMCELYMMNICNYMINAEHPYNSLYENKLPELDLSKIKNNDIIYMYLKKDILYHFILNTLPHITVNFKLITGLSDDTAPYSSDYDKNEHYETLLNNIYLTRWYAVNKDCDHPKIVAIPIGTVKSLPISSGIKYLAWYSNRTNRHIMTNYLDNIKETPFQLMRNKEKLIYISYSTPNTESTNYTKNLNLRSNLDNYIINNTNFIKNTLVFWEQYMEDMRKCKFSLIPGGIGIDNYRIIETILVGTIPILLYHHTLYEELYSDLPIIIINDFSQINEVYLNEQYEILVNRTNYNFDKILKSYWINRILNDI